ncbi:zinc-binding dehydrogenase [Microtetraspora fusca]|uniref:Zinc-binding dehydrogenase n=1 Tax=Microtetraspora fusca TaxID=1997 RepID=A0ABW6VLT3_MICFU
MLTSARAATASNRIASAPPETSIRSAASRIRSRIRLPPDRLDGREPSRVARPPSTATIEGEGRRPCGGPHRGRAAEVIVSDEQDVTTRILELTGGKGAEYVFDAVAGPGVVDLARAVAADGTLFLWGALSGRPTPYPGFDLGMPALNMRTYTMLEIATNPQRLRRGAAFVASGLRGGAFRPVVGRVFPLEQIVQAHQHMESNTQFGKIVVTTGR